MPIPASLRERGNTSDHTVDSAPDSEHKKTEHTDHTFLDPLFEWLGRDLAGTAAPSTMRLGATLILAGIVCIFNNDSAIVLWGLIFVGFGGFFLFKAKKK